MFELDASKPETLINSPAPHVPAYINQKLAELGGRQLDGKPNIRVIWGQTERKFACGRERVKYPTSFYAEKADYQFRLCSVATGEFQECTYGEFMEAKKLQDAVDMDIKFIPQFKVHRQIEWIGYPRFIIEQYEPITLLKDAPAAWEAHRYGWWFNPETGKQEWTDIIGPFPYDGRYNHFLTVKEDDGTQHGRYCAPSEREIATVREALHKREIYTPQSLEIEIKNLVDAKKAALAKSEAEIADEIASELAPHVNQMYENKVRFYK